MPDRRVRLGFVAWMAALTAAFFTLPSVRNVFVALLGGSAAVAIGYGVRRFRPKPTSAWVMLAAAVVLGTAGRITYSLLPGPPGSLKPYNWVVYALYLAMFGLIAAAFVELSRATRRVRRFALIDAAILLLVAGLLAGLLLAVPYALTPDLPALQAGARVGYVLRDVMLLAVAVHLATSVRWNPSVALLIVGTTAFVGYDAIFRFWRIRGEWQEGAAIDVIWIMFLAAWGAAALTPTMARVGRPGTRAPETSTPLRLSLIATSSLLPFALLLAGSVQNPPWYQPIVAAVSTLILVLVLLRMAAVAVTLRRQITAERVLRDSAAEFAAAGNADAVAATLESAVRRLLPARADVGVVINGGPISRSTAGPPEAAGDGPELAFALPPDRATGAGSTLVVRGDRAALAALKPRVEVLAAQAGVALDRMRLNEEIIRRANEDYFRALAQSASDVVLMLDDADRIRFASPSAETIFGTTQLIGTWLPGLVDESERKIAEALLGQTRAGSAEFAGRAVAVGREWLTLADWTIRRRDGTEISAEVSCRAVAAEPWVSGVVVTMRDVTEQRRLERELTQSARYDALTGLANRLQFRGQVKNAVEAARSRGEAAGVLLIDLDDFKVVNDRLGHEAGDAVLKTVTGRLSAEVTEWGTAARVGGDEFGVLVDGAAEPQVVDRLAAQIVSSLSRPVRVGDDVVAVTASVGVATTAESGTHVDLARNAELALYAAKSSGRGEWRHYDPAMRSAIIERLELRSALDRALHDGSLTLEYQPIVDLDSGRAAGFEALLRWEHPTRGRLSPVTFIDIAEESGAIEPIGDWVLATAIAQARRWERAADGSSPYVGVNVSVRQFRSPNLVDRIAALLTEAGLPPDRLHLEITESLLLRDDAVWEDLQRLRRLGVQIAIDDFGTGYSSLSYLRQVPLDVVKLDRMFVSSMTNSRRQRELVAGIVGLARILGLAVVAEGIETETERGLAENVGCRYGQGYLFSRPIPADVATAWLVEHDRRIPPRRTHDQQELRVTGAG